MKPDAPYSEPEMIRISLLMANPVAHAATQREALTHHRLGAHRRVAERPGEGRHPVTVQPLRHPGRIGVEAQPQRLWVHAQGAGVSIGVAADLMPRRMQRLQMRDPVLVAIHVHAVAQPAADVIGRLDPVRRQHRPGLCPRRRRKIVEAQ